ncbi:hypothetical protein NUW58_g10665 [Xylaria curta]|uniref:Uncharacterized protein n=1 Tax=Xylaria curta TaxID=42375 RepID=A0ACC1MHG1_9PEZI|nr:hypothetical protein NUW58_g10665 [Xylaria curta]
MRHHLITLMLTTGTFVSTDALRLRTPTGDKGSTLQLRHESDLTSRLEVGNRRSLVSRSLPQVEYVKRKDDDEKKDKVEHDHDDDDDGSDDSTGNAQPSIVTVTIRPTSFPSAAASPSPTPPGVNRGNDHEDHKKDKDDDSDDGLALGTGSRSDQSDERVQEGSTQQGPKKAT